jgi:Replication initiation factor
MGGARFYGRRHEYLGTTLLSDCQSRGAEDNVHVVLPGQACGVGVDALLQLLMRLRMWSSRCKVVRLDLAVDGVPFAPLDAYGAVRAGHTVAWVKRGRDGAAADTWNSSNGEGEGDTLYIGRRASQRCMRIYNRRGPTRVELETKDQYADAVALGLLERRGDDSDLARFVVGCLREFCDFGIPDGAHGSRDVALLPWWAAFVGSVERVGKLVVDRRENLSVDRTLAWVGRAVVPSLAMIVSCYGSVGERLLLDWIESAVPHLSARHVAAIREFRYAYERGEYAVLRSERAA